MSSVFSNPHGRASDAARAYVAAIVEVVGDRDPIELLSAFPAKLTAAIDGLSDELLRRPEREGKWSIVEVLKHLADAELVHSFRLRLVLAQDRPRIAGFDQDGWARRFDYRNAKVQSTIDLHATVRRANVEMLRSLDAAGLKRVGVHEERGEESVELMIKLIAGHDLVHLNQIERVKQVLGTPRA